MFISLIGFAALASRKIIKFGDHQLSFGGGGCSLVSVSECHGLAIVNHGRKFFIVHIYWRKTIGAICDAILDTDTNTGFPSHDNQHDCVKII